MVAKLTKTLVESSAIPRSGATIVRDGQLPGFFVRIGPSGRRVYYWHGRTRAGRQIVVKLGVHGHGVTAESARAAAKRVMGDVAEGRDPAAERKAAREAERTRKKAPTVRALAERFYEHITKTCKPGTVREIVRILNVYVVPELGTRPVGELRREDVIKLRDKLRDRPYQANRVLSCISWMCTFAEGDQLRPEGSNPCRHIRRFPEKRRERFYSDAELANIGKAVTDAEAAGTVLPEIAALIRLLAFTGCRLSEIRLLEWRHVDFAMGVLRLPDAKAGARAVPLGTAALTLLASLPRPPGAIFVVARRTTTRPLDIALIERSWRRLRDAAGVGDGRLHDFRHTTGTIGAQLVANAFMLRDLLGHKGVAMTSHYVAQNPNSLRPLADRVSARVAAAMGGTPTAKALEMCHLEASGAV